MLYEHMFIHMESHIFTAKMLHNKLPLEYGPREAAILRNLTESHKLPSKNEGFRRGIVAADYLANIDKGLLFLVLANLLSEAKDKLADSKSFPVFLEKLESSRALASVTVAAFAIQNGISSADSVDIFRADLENYSVLARKTGLKGVEDKVAAQLSTLSAMAHQFARKELGVRERAETQANIEKMMFAKR